MTEFTINLEFEGNKRLGDNEVYAKARLTPENKIPPGSDVVANSVRLNLEQVGPKPEAFRSFSLNLSFCDITNLVHALESLKELLCKSGY